MLQFHYPSVEILTSAFDLRSRLVYLSSQSTLKGMLRVSDEDYTAGTLV